MHHVRPGGVYILIEPGFQPVEVEGITGEPIDGGEVAAIGQLGAQTPEDLDRAQRGLGDRLGDIAARRGDRADGRYSALLRLGTQRLHHAGPLVEFRQTAAEVSGVAFFTGHFLQTAAHFT